MSDSILKKVSSGHRVQLSSDFEDGSWVIVERLDKYSVKVSIAKIEPMQDA